MVELWKSKGMPRSSVSHRFCDWAQIVGGILEANGYEGFLTNMNEIRLEKDPVRMAFTELLDLLHFGERYTAKRLLEIADTGGLFRDEISDGSPRSRAIKLSNLARRYSNDKFPSDFHRCELKLVGIKDITKNQEMFRLVSADEKNQISRMANNDSDEFRPPEMSLYTGDLGISRNSGI